ncbi:putative membrane-anchored protein [Rubricella aquisinus]|uniref:Putative membrane-anchored protein n=1 Tax=Rubricella aquisinus TaxID=2028108 RepID=A0A840WI10_9RHOB|nr:DUF3422 domain-containing protein [Rubricella aquisinus]MBB5514111.1 putative membrane-anchored protein [Rubricella aquisinus]
MDPRVIPDHPQRYELSNELHARPFPEIKGPCRAVHITIMSDDGPERDPELDRAHLVALLNRYGAQHPSPDANHYFGPLGTVQLKWERHTEFVTYTLFAEGVADTPFDGSTMRIFPDDWLAEAPGTVLTSVLVRVEVAKTIEHAEGKLKNGITRHFAPESIAVAKVVDDSALVMSDFRIHEQGQVRFAVYVTPDVGPRRIGRIVQRLLEIETYKSGAMLTLPVARDVARKVNALDRELSELVRTMASQDGEADTQTLDRLLMMSADLEALSANSAFRFGAGGAYAAIMNQRIEVLREKRVASRQTFGEFMMRRFEPAMRTCQSAERRLVELAARTERAANLLRTRVDVGLAQQNRTLLESMDRRAALQLRLQETVEGLSVVAISYYAVSLAGYLLAPFGEALGISKSAVVAVVTVPVIFAVWAFVRRIRQGIEKRKD